VSSLPVTIEAVSPLAAMGPQTWGRKQIQFPKRCVFLFKNSGRWT
jgi:hypothetical protein